MKIVHRKCPLSDNEFDLVIGDNIAQLTNVQMDFSNIKLFHILLRDSIESLKSDKIELFCKEISKDDWNNYLKDKTTWKIIKEVEDTVYVQCPIDQVLTNFAKGLGIAQIQ